MTERTSIAEDTPTSITALEEVTAQAIDFDKLLLDAIDETLMRLFNETAVKSIYFYLERICHLRREEIPEKPDIFSNSLRRLLGSGATIIEDGILKKLYFKLDLQLAEEQGYEFPDYIHELRDKYGSS